MDVKIEEWDDQDIAEGGIELEAANDDGIAGQLIADEAADENVESIQVFSQEIEGERDTSWHVIMSRRSPVVTCCLPLYCKLLTGSSSYVPCCSEALVPC